MKKPASPRLLRPTLVLALLLLALYQSALTFNDYALLWLKRGYRTLAAPSMERNALFLLGGKGSRFMRHIALSVPPDMAVVVPEVEGEFSEQNILQFFLMPRSIVACGCAAPPQRGTVSETCRACLQQEGRAVPAIGAFPPPELMAGMDFIPFDPQGWYRGLYMPGGSSARAASEPYIAMETPLLSAAFLDALALMLLFIFGALVARLIDRDLRGLEWAAAAMPLGMGLLTWMVFILSWLGLRVALGLYLVLMAAPLLLHLARREPLLPRPRGRPRLPRPAALQGGLRSNPLLAVPVLLLTLLMATAFAISIGRGYSLYDGIANWALKGYGIALEGSVYAGERWGGHALAYPQNVPLMIAFFRLLDGDVLPGSKAIFPLFAASILAAFYAFMRRFKVPAPQALLGAGAVLSVPFIYLHATIGWGNLIMAGYLVLAVFFLTLGSTAGSRAKKTLGGFLLALAAWTRPEGLAYALALAALFAAYDWKRGRDRSLKWLLPTVLVAGSWLAFSYPDLAQDRIGQTLGGLGPSLQSGWLRGGELASILRYALGRWSDPTVWGLLFWSLPPLLVLGALGKGLRRRPAVALVGAAGLIGLLIPLSIFYLGSFTRDDMDTFLWVFFDRAQIQGAVLLFAAAFLAAAGGDPRAGEQGSC